MGELHANTHEVTYGNDIIFIMARLGAQPQSNCNWASLLLLLARSTALAAGYTHPCSPGLALLTEEESSKAPAQEEHQAKPVCCPDEALPEGDYYETDKTFLAFSPMAAHTSLIIFFTELRRSIRSLGLSIILTTLVIFFVSPEMLHYVQAHLSEKLYFFSVAGPFLSHVKLALFGAMFLLMPWFMTVLWRAMGKPFKVSGLALFLFIFFTCILFYAGTMFCYWITLPLGIKFLLGFGSEELKPVISITRFVNFITLFILAFGVIFELPMFMVFMARVRVFSRKFYEKNRRYALLLIAIVAALLTPTPDIVNMLLMGGPLYLLYEAGIIILMVMRVP